MAAQVPSAQKAAADQIDFPASRARRNRWGLTERVEGRAYRGDGLDVAQHGEGAGVRAGGGGEDGGGEAEGVTHGGSALSA